MDSTTAPRPPQNDSPSNESIQWNQPAAKSPNPVFFNKEGIRSGWRILVYACLALLLYGVELVPVSLFVRAQDPYKVSTIIWGEAMVFLAAFGAGLLMARIEGRPSSVYGLPLQNAFGKRFWQGMLIGICEISLIVGCMAIVHAYSFGPLSFHGAQILKWGALWLIAAILIALPEEFLFRGYLQYTLADGIGFWPAALALSVFFALVHLTNSGENWFGVANIFFTGLLWAFTLRRTGTLWLAVGWHAAFDFGESFLYSVPDSGGIFEGHLSNATVAHGRAWLTGGEVGPEGSLLAFLTLVLGAILIHFLFPSAEKSHRES
jgi:membrane protease YdiL (CAAX protease family)